MTSLLKILRLKFVRDFEAELQSRYLKLKFIEFFTLVIIDHRLRAEVRLSMPSLPHTAPESVKSEKYRTDFGEE